MDGQQMDEGRKTEHGHPISSPCDELKICVPLQTPVLLYKGGV